MVLGKTVGRGMTSRTRPAEPRHPADALFGVVRPSLLELEHVDTCCSDNCGGSYCRSRVTPSAHVVEVSTEALAEELTGRTISGANDETELHLYAAERIIRAARLSDGSLWEVVLSAGCYGQEIGGATLDRNVAQKLVAALRALEAMDAAGKIRAALIAEYGFLLEDLVGVRDWSAETVDRSDVVVADREHIGRLDARRIEAYRYRTLPRGVVLAIPGERYRLIDGHHRLHAVRDRRVRMVVGRP